MSAWNAGNAFPAFRAQTPIPRFLYAAAAATTEAALLVAPEGASAREAIDHLKELQTQRLNPEIHQGAPVWRRFTGEMHLMRAFWQLAGLGNHKPLSWSGSAQ